MNKISLLCPTRWRPNDALRMVESVINTVNHPERIEILFYIDSDDNKVDEYKEKLSSYMPWMSRTQIFIDITVGEPMSVSKSWNIIAGKATGNLFKMCNDDLVYETKGWDDRLDLEFAKYPDEIVCMWFNDNIQKGRMCTFPIISRKWYETVGYFSPGRFLFLYNDTWVHDIAKKIGREHYIGDVMNRHLHHSQTKIKDETTIRSRLNGAIEKDGITFTALEDIRIEDANKLKGVMNI